MAEEFDDGQTSPSCARRARLSSELGEAVNEGAHHRPNAAAREPPPDRADPKIIPSLQLKEPPRAALSIEPTHKLTSIAESMGYYRVLQRLICSNRLWKEDATGKGTIFSPFCEEEESAIGAWDFYKSVTLPFPYIQEATKLGALECYHPSLGKANKFLSSI